jgi:hypothetical protein
MVVRERTMRRIRSNARRIRSIIVGGGSVVTMNSVVVGEGRRIRSRGAVVSILAGLWTRQSGLVCCSVVVAAIYHCLI